MDGLYDDDGDFKKGAFVFRTLDDCSAIIKQAEGARRAAVIGGGLLGLEAARGLMNRGLEVDVVHLMGWLMDTQLDSLSGQLLQQSLEELGVQFRLEKLTTAVLGDDRVTGLQFKDGDTLDCDLVVMSAGIRPNVDLARMAGLHVRRGILVNDGLTCPQRPGHLRHWRVRRAPQPGVRTGRAPVGTGPRAGRAAHRAERRVRLRRFPDLHQAQGDGRRTGGSRQQGPAG